MNEKRKYKYVSELVRRIEGIPSAMNTFSVPLSNDQFHPPAYASVVQSLKEVNNAQGLPASEILRINKEHDTDRKDIVSAGDRDSVDQTQAKYPFKDDEVRHLGAMDTREIMEAIQELRDQQEKLKRLHEDHDRKLESLIHQQPAIHRGFTLIRQKTLRQQGSGGSTHNEVIRRPQKPADRYDEQKQHHRNVYVQLEQLYANIHLMHFPSKTIQDVIGPRTSLFRGSEVYATIYDTLGTHEIDKLIQENDDLKKKIAELEAKQRNEMPQLRTPQARGRNNQRYEPQVTDSGSSDLEEFERNGQKDTAKEVGFDPTGDAPFNLGRKTEVNCVTGRPTTRPSDGSHTQIKSFTIYHKMSNYFQKLAQEKKHAGFKQISRPFYITHEGYRAQLEVYFNGNGTGFEKCMSVFLRLVPGENDNRLNWPVKLSLQVTLMNQRRQAESLEGKPTPQFEYSQPQGRSDKDSDCWGLVEFVSHEKTAGDGFIVDDTIQLRIKLRFETGVDV